MWDNSDSFEGDFWGADDTLDFWMSSDIFVDFHVKRLLSTAYPVRIERIVSNSFSSVYILRIISNAIATHSYRIIPVIFSANVQRILSAAYPVRIERIMPNPYTSIYRNLIVPASFGRFIPRILPIVFPVPTWARRIIPAGITATANYARRIIPSAMRSAPQTVRRIIPAEIGGGALVSHSDTWDIQLDGYSIKGFTAGVQVVYSDSSYHNEITVNVISEIIYYDLDISYQFGEARLKLITGAVEEDFLLEKITGIPQKFELWGRSLSAQHDLPHSEKSDYNYDNYQAAAIAADMASDVNWDTSDWPVELYELSGTPIDGIADLAGAPDAIIRCNIDGQPEIRARFPVRPGNMMTVANLPVIRRFNMLSFSTGLIVGQGINQITIEGPAYDDSEFDPQIITGDAPLIGTPAEFKVYFEKYKKPDDIRFTVTDGNIRYSGYEIETIENEIVTFDNGFGEADFPVRTIIDSEWLGDSAGTISFTPYSKDLTTSREVQAIAQLTYKTKSYKYTCYNADVLQANGKLLIPVSGDDVAVTVQIGNGDKPAENNIAEDRIKTTNVAIVRGTAELDKIYYDFKTLNVKIPFDPDIMVDGGLIIIDNGHRNLVGVWHVRSVTRDYRRAKITASIDAVQAVI